VRAQAESSILILPAPRWRTLARAARSRPRSLAAGAFVALTVLSGVVAPAEQAVRAAAATSVRTGMAAEDPAVVAAGGGPGGPAFYPLVLFPAPAGGPVPTGKGMWINRLDAAAGGDVDALVRQAQAAGLTHVYLRLGSSRSGFYAAGALDRLLPAAHRAGLKVVGWDFAYLDSPLADAARARIEAWYATPSGDRIDAFSADIETAAEGTRLSAAGVAMYGEAVRAALGEHYPLIATVPRPSGSRWFPYASLAAFDAVAPMVYWGNRNPATDAAGAIADLAFLNKPVLPIGQAYNMAVDGGPAGSPSGAAIRRFIEASAAGGAKGVSFWVWDQATADEWAAITAAPAPAG
jgi:hypothetical protein